MPSDSTGQHPPAKPAGPVPPSNPPDAKTPTNKKDELGDRLPARSGSTDSHKPNASGAELATTGSSALRHVAESDIAQFLANPHGLADNTDDAPTVITKGQAVTGSTPPPGGQPYPLPVVVSIDAPSIAGRRLGHYELIEAVGAGGMAAVLKARDTELGRTVALKILPPEAARDPEGVTRFKQEARAAAALDHENIARVYYCGEDQGLHFIAFEFVEGINLRQMIDRRGQLPAVECVRYMMQVAAGLNHAAERGVVHRDIKPSNILITPDGRAKIVDMGLARHLGSESVNGGVTQSGVTLGTFDYISPEQALDPRRADVRSDIYSLGCTFYHALTGRPPVPEGTAARKLRAHQNESPLDPRELNPAIPDELAAILARMMAKDPTYRYQSPTELIAHLKGLAERLDLGADPLAHDTAAKSVPAEMRLLPQAPRFRPWWVLAATAVVLAVVAFVIATSNPTAIPGGLPLPDQTKKAPEVPITNAGVTPPVSHPLPPATTPVATVEELVKRLEDPSTTKVQLATGEFDLSDLTQSVAFNGKKLELIGSSTGVTRLILNASENRDAPGTLTLKATDSLAVRNVWFDLKLDPRITAGGVLSFGVTKPVGVRIEDAAKVEFSDCLFTAIDEKLDNHEPRSVAVTRADSFGQISALRCVFRAGSPRSAGIAVSPGTRVSITDSGFAPHAAAVLVETGKSGDLPPQSEVRLEHSSFMLEPGGAVVETGAPASVRVVAADCLFAPADGPPIRSPFAASEVNRRGVVIRVVGDKPDGVALQVPEGRMNGYYNVDPLSTRAGMYTFADCKTAVPTIDDRGRAELKQSPWAEPQPYTTVASESPWKAFKLKVTGADIDPALLTGDAKKPVPLGVAFHNPADNVRRAYPDMVWAFYRPKVVTEVKKIWWPNAEEKDIAPGIYTDLSTLLKAVKPDETIYIHHTGELPLDTLEIKSATKPSEGDIRLTFQPVEGFKPVLVIQSDNDLNQTLFKLKAGEVTFVGVHFKLKPNRPRDGQIVSAVAVIGGKGCTFKNCIFTLAEEDDSKVAVVHLPDVAKEMAMDPAMRPLPKVVFDRCLIRGKGRAVWVEVSRPLNLDLTDTLTAIDGPVFFAEAGGKATGTAMSTAKLTRVTALAGGPVVEMRGSKTSDAMRPGGLVKLEVETDACLFVAVPGAGRALVELDGVDPADVKTILNWRAAKANRYANFEMLSPLAIIRPGSDNLPKEWTRSNWIDNVGEPPPEADKRFGEVKFTTPVNGLKDLATVKPADMVVKTADFADLTGMRMLEAGVDPATLPPLPEEMK